MTPTTLSPREDGEEPMCSFCRALQHDVDYLFFSPLDNKIGICDECLEICRKYLETARS